jgi:uncharacterized protein (TIGR02996 family)
MTTSLLGLLAACKEQPDEDLPRQVLADWLDDHGQPDHAECVRLSCLCERLPKDDLRRTALRAALDDPRRPLGRWLAPLRALFPHVTLRGGLLRVKARPEELLAHRPQDVPADILPWLETLRLHGAYGFGRLVELAEAGWLERFTALAVPREDFAAADVPNVVEVSRISLAHLRHLDVRYSSRDLDWLRAVVAAEDRLGALRSLRLSSADIGDEGVRILAESPLLGRLASLDLSYTRIGPAGLAGLAALAGSAHAGALVDLDLSSNSIHARALRALVESPYLGRLRTLRLSACQLGRSGSLAPLRSWPADRALEHLDLCNNDLTDAHLQALGGSPVLATLRTLELSGWKASAAGLRALTRGLPGPGLRRLWLRDVPVGDEGAGVLADCPALAELRELNLAAAGVGPDGALRLACSPHLRRLEYLGLGRNRLGPAGFRALATGATPGRRKSAIDTEPSDAPFPALRALDLRHTLPARAGLEALFSSALVGQLEVLSLTDNRLFDAGVALLAACPLAELRFLELRTCALGDAGVRHLSDSPHLRRLVALDLWQNAVGDEGARALAGSANLSALAWLWLRLNKLTDAGAEALLAARPDGWAELDLAQNRISGGLWQRIYRASVVD